MRSNKKPWEHEEDKKNPLNNTYGDECLHKACSSCHGTGKKEDGALCFHFLVCHCSKCMPRY
jgi:hypothetical protein